MSSSSFSVTGSTCVAQDPENRGSRPFSADLGQVSGLFLCSLLFIFIFASYLFSVQGLHALSRSDVGLIAPTIGCSHCCGTCFQESERMICRISHLEELTLCVAVTHFITSPVSKCHYLASCYFFESHRNQKGSKFVIDAVT